MNNKALTKAAEKGIENWYHQWMKDQNKSGIATINVLDLLKDYSKFILSKQEEEVIEFAEYLTDNGIIDFISSVGFKHYYLQFKEQQLKQ